MAAVRITVVRQHYSDLYWLAVSADAIGAKIKQLMLALYKQMTGKEVRSEEKDEHELQTALVEAMSEKKRLEGRREPDWEGTWSGRR